MSSRHPFRRAFPLALAIAAMMVFTGTPSLYETFAVQSASAAALAFALMTIPGAFLAALPARIRRRNEPRMMSTRMGCLLAFGAGIVLILGARIAGAGDLRALAGAMQGSIGAIVFAACAFFSALVAARLADRRSK